MKHMLDLFSGLGGASSAFQDSPDWKVTTIDIDTKFKPDKCADILELSPGYFNQYYDMIWASPPCPAFSIASVSHHWKDSHIPKTREAVNSIHLVYHTLWLINQLQPDWWYLENPTGMLRNLIGKPKATITLCQYGDTRMKPTDLWGQHPPSFKPKKCHNDDPCHEKAPRGSKTGTQGLKTREERAKMPYGLSKAVLESVEQPYKTGQKKLEVSA